MSGVVESMEEQREGQDEGRIAQIDLLNAEAFATRHTDTAAARRDAGAALALSLEAGYVRGRAEALRTQASIMHVTNEHDGFDLALEALALFREENDLHGQATAHNVLACFYHTFLQYDSMLEHLGASYAIADAIGDRRMLALIQNNMAVASEKLDDFSEAIRLYESSRVLWGELRDETWYWLVTASLAYALYRTGLADEARSYFVECVERLKDRAQYDVAWTHLNYALLLADAGEFPAAEAQIAAAVSLCAGGQNEMALSYLHLVRGEVCEKRGDRAASQAALLESRRAAIAHNNRDTLPRTLKLLAANARAAGDFEAACGFLDEYLAFRETVFTESIQTRSRTFQAVHRVEWMQKEAQLVQQQNEELQLLNKRLVATIAEKDALHAEMTRHAVTDELTGVANRRHLMEFGRREFERYRRLGAPLAVVMLDVDHFKSINDRFGHAAGDEVLKGIAAAGGEGVRAIDAFGRWGGEEFCIVLPGARLGTARRIAERIRASIEASAFGDVLDAGGVTASLGVAEVEPRHRSLDDLLNDADAALYHAKRTGRNRVSAAPELSAAPEPLAQAA